MSQTVDKYQVVSIQLKQKLSSIRPLPLKITPFLMQDFRCTEIVEHHLIRPLLPKTTHFLRTFSDFEKIKSY
jgi:hypothetical protein